MDGFSDDAALLLDTCKGLMAGFTSHWAWACVLSMASPFGHHGAIVSPDGSLLFMTLLLLMDGWFAGWMVQQ